MERGGRNDIQLSLFVLTFVFTFTGLLGKDLYGNRPQRQDESVVHMMQDHTYNGNESPTQFLVIGDWGGLPYSPFSTMIQQRIAAKMALLAKKQKSQFVLGLGDNFYYDGVNSTQDPRFKETYEDIFTADSLQVPWFMVAGNHDHHGNVDAQIEYSKYSKRWRFPDYNYTFSVAVGGGISARFVMLDTIVLCGNSDRDFLGQQPQGPVDQDRANSMLQWTEAVLRESGDDYLFVCGHFPVYSIGHHGPTKCLVDSLKPLLHKYRVTAYLNGHDHNLQHIQVTDDHHKSLVDYFTIGAANFISPSRDHRHDVPKGSSKFYWGDMMAFGGFAGVRLAGGGGGITGGGGEITFYQANGTVLYDYKLKPRKMAHLERGAL